jgi:ribosome-associated toxin RatA of RatAB toxin-antitoxin module
METEYVTFEPPRVTAVTMTRGPAFLASFSGSWRFEPNDAGGTTVTFAYHFKSRPRWLRWLMEPILHSVFKRDTIRRLRALKHAAESTCAAIRGRKSDFVISRGQVQP